MSISRAIDLSGKRFGRLIVKKRAGSHQSTRAALWLCVCDCGNSTITNSQNLRKKKTLSCGCLHLENLSKNSTTHGLSDSNTYKIWSGMIQRCTNPKRKEWNNYGGRGIEVCKEWFNFEIFLKDMGERPKGFDIDRKNNNRNYCKENCRWVSRAINIRNSRRALLSIENVKKIKLKLNKGYTHSTISNMFGVSIGAIADISSGRTWKEV